LDFAEKLECELETRLRFVPDGVKESECGFYPELGVKGSDFVRGGK
jgi:hypothetical protein